MAFLKSRKESKGLVGEGNRNSVLLLVDRRSSFFISIRPMIRLLRWAITLTVLPFIICELKMGSPSLAHLASWLLCNWHHRTGKWSLDLKAPLYRLRSALSRL